MSPWDRRHRTKFENGVLSVALLKSAETRKEAKKIDVKSGREQSKSKKSVSVSKGATPCV
jgi:hypothetical protein